MPRTGDVQYRRQMQFFQAVRGLIISTDTIHRKRSAVHMHRSTRYMHRPVATTDEGDAPALLTLTNTPFDNTVTINNSHTSSARHIHSLHAPRRTAWPHLHSHDTDASTTVDATRCTLHQPPRVHLVNHMNNARISHAPHTVGCIASRYTSKLRMH